MISITTTISPSPVQNVQGAVSKLFKRTHLWIKSEGDEYGLSREAGESVGKTIGARDSVQPWVIQALRDKPQLLRQKVVRIKSCARDPESNHRAHRWVKKSAMAVEIARRQLGIRTPLANFNCSERGAPISFTPLPAGLVAHLVTLGQYVTDETTGEGPPKMLRSFQSPLLAQPVDRPVRAEELARFLHLNKYPIVVDNEWALGKTGLSASAITFAYFWEDVATWLQLLKVPESRRRTLVDLAERLPDDSSWPKEHRYTLRVQKVIMRGPHLNRATTMISSADFFRHLFVRVDRTIRSRRRGREFDPQLYALWQAEYRRQLINFNSAYLPEIIQGFDDVYGRPEGS